jgi:hypothetical protein
MWKLKQYLPFLNRSIECLPVHLFLAGLLALLLLLLVAQLRHLSSQSTTANCKNGIYVCR